MHVRRHVVAVEDVANVTSEQALEVKRSDGEVDATFPAFQPGGWSVHYRLGHEQMCNTEDPIALVDEAEDQRADQTVTDSVVDYLETDSSCSFSLGH